MTLALQQASPVVSAVTLARQLDDVVPVDVRPASQYSQGHLRGAVSFPVGTLAFEDSSESALHGLATSVQHALGAAGISADDRVVLVDNGDGTACSMLFLCELAGLSEVQVAWGGMPELLHATDDITTAPTTREPIVFNAEPSLDWVAPLEHVRLSHAAGYQLVDTRSQLEHEGIVGAPCCAYRGNIPGSLHLEWTSLLSSTGSLLPGERVAELARAIGLSEDDDIIMYCHTGHRSAVATLALRDAGFARVRNSFGSWHEWSHRHLPPPPEPFAH